MESRNQFAYDGQELEQDDVQAIIDNAAFADDHVFAELLRLEPLQNAGSPARGIMPFSYAGAAVSALPAALVAPNGASGSVLVAPFRAFVGSRTLASADAQKNFRELRSALSVIAGATALTQVASFAANASGNPRWDLIVAAVAIDANAASSIRYVKDTTSDDATPQTVVTQVATTVTLQVVTGTAAATPALPATPADTSNIYYVPIAAVRIPTGFGGTSTVLSTDIVTFAPLVGLNAKASGGGMVAEPADSAYGALLTTFAFGAGIGAWGSSGARPPSFMPSTARGGFIKEIALDFSAGAHSIQPDQGGILDASRDWRYRRFLILATFGLQASGMEFPWESGSAGLDMLSGADVGTPILATGTTRSQAWVAASSHQASTAGLNTYGSSHALLLQMTHTYWAAVPNAAEIDLVVDMTNGKLAVSYGGSPAGKAFIVILATGQYENQ